MGIQIFGSCHYSMLVNAVTKILLGQDSVSPILIQVEHGELVTYTGNAQAVYW